MATLVLQTAGAAAGALFGPVGAAVGRALGGLAGAAIDRALIPGARTEGPRLASLDVQTSTEGAAVPRVYGRARIAGQVIWATRFEEETRDEGGGGKGRGGTQRSYRYFANFAVGLCEGPVQRIGRVWADGKPLDLNGVTMRRHLGDEAQEADPLIEAKQGDAPAYRGLAYVVFERLPLDPYGNRLPQLSFEVIRVVDRLEGMVKAVTLIPGATEFGYAPDLVTREGAPGVTVADNRHVGTAASDFEASIDELCALCPALERVALVVAWFADDLRVTHCRPRPKVEDTDRRTRGATWEVDGVTRSAAAETSRALGRPAYGGTPSDASVVAAIRSLSARGLKVTFYPFLLMDVAPGNGLPNPWGGGEQAASWRGRITVHPAPGRTGSPDGSGAAADDVAGFVGTAAAADFDVDGERVRYAGPAEWSLRRMILHYAHLCAVAGGVDAFLVGSELIGLTTVCSARRQFPFVDALKDLAADVSGILPETTRVSYAADWSEFFGHHPPDGSGDHLFHLDPLWASPHVDFVGIDVYWPLSDWRDGDHLDAAVAGSVYEAAYLGGNVAGGEGFDWHYPTAAARREQERAPITDGMHGKPWVFRYKDLKGWWSHRHFDRLDGSEVEEPTDWLAESKPFWFTEVGCPAIDRGANQPNVFVDPKSSESNLPRFSNGARDDAMQRRYLEAMIRHFDPAAPGHASGGNPISSVDGARMVRPDGLHLWTWDARPWPAFPALADVWADGLNWSLGHWLNGRLGSTTLGALIGAILADHGFEAFDVDGLDVVVTGAVVDRPMSARATLAPLLEAFGAVAADHGTRLHFGSSDRAPVATIEADGCVDGGSEAPVRWTRMQDSELPIEVRIGYGDAAREFAPAVAMSRRLAGATRRSLDLDVAVLADEATMRRAADAVLFDRWAGRERVSLTLPPSRLALQPGDVVTVVDGGDAVPVLIEEIEDAGPRRVTGRRLDRGVFRGAGPAPGDGGALAVAVGGGGRTVAPAVFGAPAAVILDLPAIDAAVPAERPWAAAFARPWPGSLAVERSRDGDGFEAMATLTRPARIGALAEPLGPGPEGQWDRGGRIRVVIAGGLEGRSAVDVLAGANLAAVRAASGAWELLQFASADLVGVDTYELSILLRGQFGTEDAMAAGHAAGTPFVLVDRGLVPLPVGRDEIGVPFHWRMTPAGADPAGPAAVHEVLAPGGRGLLPPSPVHLRATRDPGSGDVTVSWVRRTRVGGDSWGEEEVPLGEERERYRLDILGDGGLRRRIVSAAPSAIYTAAEQVEDFGVPPASLAVRVAQIAAGLGAGIAREAILDV